MKELKLSQIQKVMEAYWIENCQVYTAINEQSVPVDLIAVSLADRADIILYAIYKLVPFFETISIIDDAEAEKEGLVTYDTILETSDLLRNYGVFLNDSEASPAIMRWLVVKEEEIPQLLKCTSLSQFLSDKGYIFTENMIFTHVYFEYTFTASKLESIVGYYNSVRDLEGSQNIKAANPAVRCALETDTRSLGFDNLEERSYLELDGLTSVGTNYPILDMCRMTSNSMIPFREFRGLYDYLCSTEQSTLVLSANNIEVANPLVAFAMLGKFNIPDMLLYLLALVHINTGKYIEFIKYGASCEDRYLDIVSTLMHRNDGYLHERIQAHDSIKINLLYFVRVSNELHICALNKKDAKIEYQVARASSLFSHIVYKTNHKSVVFDSHYVASASSVESYEEGSVHAVPKAEYVLLTSAYSNSTVTTLSQEEIPFTEAIIHDLPEVIVNHIAVDLNISADVVTQTMFDSFVYRLLRLLEQHIFNYSRVLNITDLICFTYQDELYVGVASYCPEYQVTVYHGCTDKGYTSEYVTNSLIPLSVLNSVSYADPFFSKLSESFGESQGISKCESFSDEETMLLLRSFASNTQVAVEPTLKSDLNGDDSLKPTAYNLAYIAAHKLSAQMCRKTEWDVLSGYFKSFGMRDLPITRSALSIYGTVYSTKIYPVAIVGVGGIHDI